MYNEYSTLISHEFIVERTIPFVFSYQIVSHTLSLLVQLLLLLLLLLVSMMHRRKTNTNGAHCLQNHLPHI